VVLYLPLAEDPPGEAAFQHDSEQDAPRVDETLQSQPSEQETMGNPRSRSLELGVLKEYNYARTKNLWHVTEFHTVSGSTIRGIVRHVEPMKNAQAVPNGRGGGVIAAFLYAVHLPALPCIDLIFSWRMSKADSRGGIAELVFEIGNRRTAQFRAH